MGIVPGARAQPASARDPASRKFIDSVGLCVKFLQGQPMSMFPMLSDLNVKWVREHVYWQWMETSPGVYNDFHPALRQQLAYYKANDIGLVALLTLSKSTTKMTTPAHVALHADPDAFGRFAAHVAHLLDEEGVRYVLEIGNEPHNSSLLGALGGQWNGKAPSPWLDHYVRMVNAAVREVKAYDPRIKLLAGDDMWVIDYWLLEAGLDPRLDGLTVHPYTPGVPEIAAVAHDTDWVRPFVAVDPDRSLGSAFTRLQAAAQKKRGRPVEIWITEMGWPSMDGDKAIPGGVPERTVAAYLPRSYILAAEAGVKALLWFSSQDRSDGPLGLTRNDASHRLAYEAFKTMTSELGPLGFVKRLYGGKGKAAVVQAFLFSDGQADVVVAWNATNAAGESLIVPQGALRELVVRDLLGVERRLAPAGGRFLVPLGLEPVYVRMPSSARSDGIGAATKPPRAAPS